MNNYENDDQKNRIRSSGSLCDAGFLSCRDAIGHRVWQSVEHYMANYPTVIVARKDGDKEQIARAMHTAFEDQLLQKVMPKLRGIDTRGISLNECLNPIQGMIDRGILGQSFRLAEDFELACRLGYGQFIWQTANYLNDEQE